MQDKILTLDEIVDVAGYLKDRNKIVGFTNGCFDILHAGHVTYLEKAKSLVDVLIVGLNSDSSVKRIKGPKRPINSEIDRALVLSGLSSVDWVVIFNEDTPIEIIKAIKPDLLIKGADWKGKRVVGAEFVLSYGGSVEFIDFLEDRSTTGIIEKVLREYCDYVE